MSYNPLEILAILQHNNLGRYDYERLLGNGSFGEVHLLTHEGFREEEELTQDTEGLLSVAMKIPQRNIPKARIAEHREVLRRERALCLNDLLRGHAMVQILDAAELKLPESGGQSMPAIFMEYLSGGSLGEVVETQGPYTPLAAIDLLLPTVRALEVLHEGLERTHNDLCPDSFLFTTERRDRLKITDLGAARVLRKGTRNQYGRVGFVPLELNLTYQKYLGDATLVATPASDVFSFATVLYYAMTGKPFFTGEEFPEVAKDQLSVEYITKRIRDTAPLDDPKYDKLKEVLHIALQPEPHTRFSDARELREALEDARNAFATTVVPPALPRARGALAQWLGEISTQYDERGGKLEEVLRAIERTPTDAEAHYTFGALVLGEASNQDSRQLYERAKQAFAEALQIDNSRAMSWGKMSIANLRLGHHDEALENISRAIALDEKNVVFRSWRAECYIIQGDLPRARDALAETDRISPGYPSVHLRMGAVDDRSGNFIDADTHYEQAIEGFREARKVPTLANAHHAYATSLVKRQEYARALDQLVLAVETNLACAPRIVALLRTIPQNAVPATEYAYVEGLIFPIAERAKREQERFNAKL